MDLRRRRHHTSLAPLPGFKDVGLIAADDPKSPAAEAFRTLRANLQFIGLGEAVRALLFTSAGPRDGKSFVASNLAWILAQMDRRILLIDADMRRPTMHKMFRISNRHGLSTALAGAVEWREAVQATRTPSLAVLPGGPVPPNPAELLSTPRMHQILQEARASYELVLIDAPPVLAVADTVELAPHVDGVILVVRSGHTVNELAKQAKEALDHAHARCLGVVLNDLQERHGGYYYYRYRYDYRGSEEAGLPAAGAPGGARGGTREEVAAARGEEEA
ncbi:MAG: CpsD/CapB family tyrosine-protein kinase [Firmicutes bacterium]|nr:CpsD/CapB family tyrosine-protein kinase [Bacillota bacterium]